MRSKDRTSARKSAIRACILALAEALLFALCLPSAIQAQSSIKLSPTASPSSGQPGVTVISVIGSGFPTGTIPAANVTVTLQPSSGGSSATTTASAVNSIIGATRRVTFQIPASITVASPTAYQVSISGSTSTGVTFASGNTAVLTINPAAEISGIAPNSGQAGQTLTVTITGLYTNFVQGATAASFGPGISVGGAAEGVAGPVTITGPTSATAQIVIDPKATTGTQSVSIATGVQQALLSNGFTILPVTTTGPPTISGFTPTSAPVGTVVNVTGANFVGANNTPPLITLNKQGGGSISAPVATFSATAIAFVIPTGAATGPLSVIVGTQSATSTTNLSIVPPASFGLTLTPNPANVIQGQSTAYAVSLTSSNGFDQLAALSVSGLPAGVTAAFSPAQITAGQTAILTVSAPANQPTSSSTLTVSASASIAGLPVTQTAQAALNVQPLTTTFLGRVVVEDSAQEPITGVTVTMLGVNGSGQPTGCTGTTRSDSGGNFAITNLGSNCVGPELIRYDGSTATSPAGVYAGVDLIYTIVANQVTQPPFVIHLPRIDNAETVMVQQNDSVDQTFTFNSIPGLEVTVYAGTVFKLVDGTEPNPFPLIAIQVPVDRLPDEMPMNNTSVGAFIVAFQPANTTASQPVAVTFPNTLNTPPGVQMALNTLNPTLGVMVQYGTGTVNSNGTQIVPDLDPNHPGHRYGLVHFDWHGPQPPPPPGVNPSPDNGGGPPGPPQPPCPVCPTADPPSPSAGEPVDLSSGIVNYNSTDLAINGGRGSIAIIRTYRTLSGNPGPFGIGTSFNYGYQLGTFAYLQGQGIITLATPDGNQFTFNQQTDGTFINTTVPALRGAVLTANQASGTYILKWREGSTYQFQTTSFGGRDAFLTSMTDPNGNTTTLTLNPSIAGQITQITDPVGRSFNLTYDTFNRVTSITDSTGRAVSYTYNSQGRLATFTDAIGGVTNYTYDSAGNLASITDPRGVVTEQNTYDSNGRVVSQTEADGSTLSFSYTLANPMVSTSPVLQTIVTDPLGHQTTYRFDPQGFLLNVTDASGQQTTLMRDPGHNNLVSAYEGTATCAVCGDPAHGDVSYTFDQVGNVLTKTDALGNMTTFTYDARFDKVTSITDPLGDTTTFTYDSAGNLLSQTDPNGNATSFAYNSFGQITQITDPLGNVTKFSYDAFANLISAADALGDTASTVYDALSRPLQTVDALGRKNQTAYDVLGRLVSQTDAQGNATHFNYDAVGNVVSVTDAKGNRTSFSYDGVSRLLTRTDPLGHSDSRTYDKSGNLIQFTDRRGQTSTFIYDVLNRLVGESYQDGSAVSRSYDANGRLINATDSASGSFDFTYDAAGHLLSASNPVGAIQYTYDAAGRMTSRQVVGQANLAYAYDHASNLTLASMPQASVALAYDRDNRLSTITRADGVNSQYVYDAGGRLLSIAHAGGQKVNMLFRYSYDPVSRRVSYVAPVAQPLVTQSASYAVNAGDQVQSSTGSDGPASYNCDLDGNLISATNSSGTTEYTWDSRGRLSAISAPGGQTARFLYDPSGNIIQEAVSGPTANLTQTFVLDDLTNVAYVGTSNGDSLSILSGRFIDAHFAAVHASLQADYSLTDAVNSTVAVVDQTGRIISNLLYEPFGQTSTMSQSDYPFEYTDRIPTIGNLYYYRSRFYDAGSARFISDDPFGSLGGRNRYAYASNDPIDLVDPSGLFNSAQFFGSLGGAIGNGLGLIGIVVTAPEVAASTGGLGLGLSLYGAFKAGYGLSADIQNMISSFTSGAEIPDTPLKQLTASLFPCSRAWQDLASAADLATDLALLHATNISTVPDIVGPYGNVIAEGGGPLGPVFWGWADSGLNWLSVIEAGRDALGAWAK